jgi:hypothetical protein
VQGWRVFFGGLDGGPSLSPATDVLRGDKKKKNPLRSIKAKAKWKVKSNTK